MICSQVVTLNVIYDSDEVGKPPEEWAWSKSFGAVCEVLAAGPVKDHTPKRRRSSQD